MARVLTAAKAVDGKKIRRAERPVPVRLRPPAPEYRLKTLFSCLRIRLPCKRFCLNVCDPGDTDIHAKRGSSQSTDLLSH
jgi:hypothetical protein